MDSTAIRTLAAAFLLLTSLQYANAQEKRYGVTVFSANFLREEADFTAELGNQLLMGTPVEIIENERSKKRLALNIKQRLNSPKS